MQTTGYKLTADFSCVHEDSVLVSGILGVYLLKYLAPMKLSRFINGAAFELAQGFVPFGDIEDFLPARKSRVDHQICSMNYSRVISQDSDCPVTHIYFVLKPKSKYLDLLDCIAESSLERTVEKIFSLETMRIKEDSISDYVRDKIDSSRRSNTFREGCYFVDLPWNEDKLVEVPSNHQVALNVLGRVVIKLEKQNLNDYCKLFHWVPHSFGLVLHRSKELRKLLL